MKGLKPRGASLTSGGRTLASLVSIGPAMLRDFEQLGIRSVDELAHADPGELYERLSRLTGTRQDPCVLDTFCAAVAQARDPDLPAPMREWWYWSRLRKSKAAGGERKAAGGEKKAAGREPKAAAGEKKAAGGQKKAAGGQKKAAGGEQKRPPAAPARVSRPRARAGS
ncbi:MAG TPA: helix-hairpin-helix domain-containing protein [Polyangiaceae bacterium]|nr:helix-hairpin-helix domain-containing protein [Polyangiaceae bacterium]